MSRAQRLNIVLELAQRTEEQAAKAYEMARRLWREDDNKLLELNQYYADYAAAGVNPAGFCRAQDIARQRGFLSKLADAKKQQSEVVEKRLSICNTKQLAWQHARLKRQALQDLIERLRADENRAESRKEAKMLDEWFNQSKSRRQSDL